MVGRHANSPDFRFLKSFTFLPIFQNHENKNFFDTNIYFGRKPVVAHHKARRNILVKFNNQYIKDCEAGAGRTPSVRMRK